MKKFYLAIGFLALVGLATSTFAFGPGARADARCAGCPGLEAGNGPGAGEGTAWPGGPGAGKGAGRWAAELNLTKEQQDKLSELRKRQWAETKPLRDEMYQKRQEMRQLWANPSADDVTITAKQKELNALQQKMQEKMVQFKLEQRRVFTPEQLNKMKDLPQGFGKGRGHGKG
jgi:Spy/CpxP family protein refolding chaperone